ncbi:hypothetical protein PVAND_017496 [Polypedilum vanderplanki]|uniref:Thioredoxin n=1 Tax=Polypedilum vanderplanki TaxID=319348 RepID=S6B7Y8_POLVA|nr:hypothetical protein PVAND_017496 [Polypedilum vanderplanki]BAN67623.1 thioredoxin [Polypedilum vanderplanki]
MEKVIKLIFPTNHELKVNDKKDYEDKVIRSAEPVVLAYDAPWCNECDVVAKKINEVLQQHEGKVKMVKVDITKFPEVAKENDVKQLPTVQVAVDGKVQGQIEGSLDNEDIRKFVDRNIKTKEQYQQQQLDEERKIHERNPNLLSKPHPTI